LANSVPKLAFGKRSLRIFTKLLDFDLPMYTEKFLGKGGVVIFIEEKTLLHICIIQLDRCIASKPSLTYKNRQEEASIQEKFLVDKK